MEQLALQFDPRQISRLAARYDYTGEDRIVDEIGPAARARGWFTARGSSTWLTGRARGQGGTSGRTGPRPSRRRPGSRSLPRRRSRIGVLLALRGVQWPTASTVLHFGHEERYPILDVRALEALGFVQQNPYYTFELWWDYVTTCRRLADRHRTDMRTLDRAMWQWSREQSDGRR